MQARVVLAPGADSCGLAVMLADLLQQNLESKPKKLRDFNALDLSVGLIAQDADVSLTLVFRRGELTLYAGIVGVPDLGIVGSSDAILAMSDMPLTEGFGIPWAPKSDESGRAVLDQARAAMKSGDLEVHGAAAHPRSLLRLTRVMSVNG